MSLIFFIQAHPLTPWLHLLRNVIHFLWKLLPLLLLSRKFTKWPSAPLWKHLWGHWIRNSLLLSCWLREICLQSSNVFFLRQIYLFILIFWQFRAQVSNSFLPSLWLSKCIFSIYILNANPFYTFAAMLYSVLLPLVCRKMYFYY